MSAPIEVDSLTVEFTSGRDKLTALKNLSFSVPQGSVVGFIGPNGAGKTTTIHILLGFIEATGGSARIFGDDVRQQSARQRIGYLPEHPQSYDFLKGAELLAMSGRLFGLKGRELKRRIGQTLEMVDLQAAAKRRIATYSRGMMQRIGVAQALINDPELLILDEPTGGLDPLARRAMRALIARQREAGKTVFFSSHELSEVERVCDRVLLINRGELVAAGAVDELATDGQSLEQFFIERISGSAAQEVRP